MVDEISPTFYAAGSSGLLPFELRGRGFLDIPPDAVGVWSDTNADPLVYRNSDLTYNRSVIVGKTDNTMTLQYPETHQATVARYLGAIVSADRETVYWVNDTRPLP